MKAFIGLLMCGALGAFTACNIQQLVYMSNSNILQRNNRQTSKVCILYIDSLVALQLKMDTPEMFESFLYKKLVIFNFGFFI